MARPRKYVIKLTDDELKTLKSIIRKSNTSKTIRSRCQIVDQHIIICHFQKNK